MLTLMPGRSSNHIPTGFADQILYSKDYPYNLLYLSAYAYNSVIDSLKALRTSPQDRSYSDEYLNVCVAKDRKYISYSNIFTRKSIISRINKMRDSDLSRIVNYVNRDLAEPVYQDDRHKSNSHVYYMPLSDVISYIRENTTWTDSKIEDELFNPTIEFTALMARCPLIFSSVYKILKLYTNIPFLQEWTEYILSVCHDGLSVKLPQALYSNINDTSNVYAIVIQIDEYEIKQSVSAGLRQGDITINGCHALSDASRRVQTLTDYLGIYSNQLIDKASHKFTACFDPSVDTYTEKEANYFDYAEYFGKLKFFNAQKNVIAAVSRSLEINRSAFIVAEMGSGKTAMAIGSAYCTAKSSRFNCIVMCPGHLVEKWSREILRLYPNARTFIIEKFSDLQEIEQQLTCVLRYYPMFIIISKDTAKINFQERPAAVWDNVNHTYRCPKCGASICINKRGSRMFLERNTHLNYSSRNDIVNGNYVNSHVEYDIYSLNPSQAIHAFLEQSSANTNCLTQNNVLRSQHAGKKHSALVASRVGNFENYYTCGSSLWTATNANETAKSKWIKTKFGWMHEDVIPAFKSRYESLSPEDPARLDKTEKKIYNAVIDLEENGIPPVSAPRRYSIASYIRERLSGNFDMLIADEVHLYSASASAQANAFGDLVRCADKTIALTGTLSNGYSTSVFNLTFRLYPKAFRKLGYKFDSTQRFIDNYGVKKESVVYHTNDIGEQFVTRKAAKEAPGVSPELFTNLLLDKTVFLSLSDMSENLPPYTEIPVGVQMDDATAASYASITSKLRDIFANPDIPNSEVAFQAVQKLNLYPDMPYNVAPIYSTKTGDRLLEFPDAFPEHNDFLSNKDLKVLEIVNEKIAKGENVLIYVEFVNKVDSIARMLKMFKTAGINTAVLNSSVKSSEREAWIDKQVKSGVRVLITNPALVETGLDLLAFSNILFYHNSYSIHRLRQASRRSLRLNQVNPVNVYFLYFQNTTQETVLALLAAKLQAAMAIEGKFSEEGLQASMGQNDDILTQIAQSLVNNIEHRVQEGTFTKGIGKAEKDDGSRFKLINMLEDDVKPEAYTMFKKLKKTESVSLRSICA